jgi:hypothetical protein
MAGRFFAVCVKCGARRNIRRHEILHATQPHCHRCGAPLELSDAAKESLAEVQAKQAGDRLRAVPATDEEPPTRLLPVRETTRYEWWDHPDMYRWAIYDQERRGHPDLVSALKAAGPLAFYQGLAGDAGRQVPTDERMGAALINAAEEALYAAGRPYYKVWPSIATALTHTEMRVDGEYFRVPYRGFEIKFPKKDNPMWPACSMLGAMLPGDQWLDGRLWSLVMVWFSNVPEFWDRDDAGNYWAADMPIKPGLSLEDALDQTALARQCPDPGMARRMMRVLVGTCFFGVDKHEIILPEVRRSVIEYYQQERRQPNPTEAKEALADAKRIGLFGWKVGSEIDLPTKVVNARPCDQGDAKERHELTAGYIRRGHMRMQPHGEGMKQRKLIFVAPTVVRPDLPIGSQHGYRVRIT